MVLRDVGPAGTSQRWVWAAHIEVYVGAGVVAKDHYTLGK